MAPPRSLNREQLSTIGKMPIQNARNAIGGNPYKQKKSLAEPELNLFKILENLPGAAGLAAKTISYISGSRDQHKSVPSKPKPIPAGPPLNMPASDVLGTSKHVPSNPVFPYQGTSLRHLGSGRYEALSPHLGRFVGTLNEIGTVLPVAASLSGSGQRNFHIQYGGAGTVRAQLQNGQWLAGSPEEFARAFTGFYQDRPRANTTKGGKDLTRVISRVRAGLPVSQEELLMVAPLVGIALKHRPNDLAGLEHNVRLRVREGIWVNGPNPPKRLVLGKDPPPHIALQALISQAGDVGAALNKYNPVSLLLKAHIAAYGNATGRQQGAKEWMDKVDDVSAGIGRFGGEATPMAALALAAPEVAFPLALTMTGSAATKDIQGLPRWLETRQPPQGGFIEGLAQAGRPFYLGRMDPWTDRPVSLEDATYGTLSLIDQSRGFADNLHQIRTNKAGPPPLGTSDDPTQMGSPSGAHSTFQSLKAAWQDQLTLAREQYKQKHGISDAAPQDVVGALKDAKRLGLAYYAGAGIRSFKPWLAILRRDCGAWFVKHARLVFDEIERLWYQGVLHRTGQVVSTRSPEGDRTSPNSMLRSDANAMQEDPLHFASRLGQLSTHDGYQDVSGSYEGTMNRGAENLTSIYEIAADIAKRGSKNVIGQNYQMNEIAREFRIPKEKAAGVLAVLSIQKKWEENVALAKNLVKTYLEIQGKSWTAEMDRTVATIHGRKRNRIDLSDVVGKSFADLGTDRQRAKWLRVYDEAFHDRSYNELTPRGKATGKALKRDGSSKRYGWTNFEAIEKAMRILESTSMGQIQKELGQGHKVPNFYNNIVNPWHPGNFIVADTHGVGAAHHRPLSGKSLIVQQHFGEDQSSRSSVSGMKGSYGLYHEMTERAALQNGYKYANQFQGAIWEVMRTISRNLTKQERIELQKIWGEVGSGALSVDQGRQFSRFVFTNALARSKR